ncbi:glycosyltransferase [Mucilaginibacter sp. CAU 1740]|uniref:glycosyltransferase n=1 Tax=Mucilaginibacter sp. CAU 1740 TaxID=3140365 RepID=UPI00325BC20F
MNKKIKICYVISSLARGGPVNVLYNIVKFMDPAVYDISIITLVPENEANRVNDFKQLPVKLITVYGTGKLKPVSLYFNLKKAIKDLAPDIIHSHCPRSLFLLGVMPTKIKQSFTVHIYPGIQQIVMYGPLAGRAVIFLSKYFIKRIDLPIACAENVADALWQNEHLKVKAVPNCGSYLPTTISAQDKATLRDKLGLKQNVTYFIYIGRLSREKNIEFIVSTFNKLKMNNVGLIVLGEGALQEVIDSYSFPNFIKPGFVENVNEYILASDYYVSASLTEGLANTLLETMALGVPFLLSDIPPHYEVYNKDPEDFKGVIFKNNDEADFEKKVKELLAYPKDKAAEAGRRCFSNYYTPEKMSQGYQDAYQEFLANL